MSTLSNSLTSFESTRKNLISTGVELQTLFDEMGEVGQSREVGLLVKSLEVDSIKIAVIGEFKGGKSTLINALIGKELLPSWTDECSATITQLVYGQSPGVTVNYLDSSSDTHSIDRLNELATVENVNYQNISYIEVQYPAEILANNLIIVDTPGTNSAEKARELITKRFMKIADAAILVLNAEYLLTANEVEFIKREISQQNYGKVFVVINRCDLFSDEKENLNRVISDTSIKLKELIPGLEKVYPLSALNAMEGREDDNDGMVADSGIHVLEDDLAHYVVEQSGITRLQRVQTAFSEILHEFRGENQLQLDAISLDLEKLDIYAKNVDALMQKETDSIIALKQEIHDGFMKMRNKLENDIKDMAETSKTSLEARFGGKREDAIDGDAISSQIEADAQRWLAHADSTWNSFYNDVLIYTANYLSQIDNDMLSASNVLVPQKSGSIVSASISPIRINVQMQVRQYTDYVEEMVPKQVTEKSGGGSSTGLGVGMIAAACLLGGGFGAILAIFGGIALFDDSSPGSSVTRTIMEKIKKPITKQVNEYQVVSLREPYTNLISDITRHTGDILNNALDNLNKQVESVAHGHFEKMKHRGSLIADKRNSGNKNEQTKLFENVISRLDGLIEKLRVA